MPAIMTVTGALPIWKVPTTPVADQAPGTILDHEDTRNPPLPLNRDDPRRRCGGHDPKARLAWLRVSMGRIWAANHPHRRRRVVTHVREGGWRPRDSPWTRSRPVPLPGRPCHQTGEFGDDAAGV